jgi:hypothetical protein
MRFRGRGAAKLPEMEKRKRATEATLARYRGKAFAWSKGVTCIHLAWAQMRNMGHRPPTLPRFRSALLAKRALQEGGFEAVGELLDSMVPRIAPAQMALGDIATMPGDAGLDGIVVCAGPGRVFGWREDAPGLVVLTVNMSEFTGAWRL